MSSITKTPEENPRPDAERLDHARMIVAQKYGEKSAAWLVLRWSRILCLLPHGQCDQMIAALERHVRANGDEDDQIAMKVIREAVFDASPS